MTTLQLLSGKTETFTTLFAANEAFSGPGVDYPVAIILGLLVLLLLNALFVAAEFALVKVHVSQAEEAVAESKAGAGRTLEVVRDGNTYLSACQFGISITSLMIGGLGAPLIAHWMNPLLDALTVSAVFHNSIGFAISFTILAVIHVIASEQIPRVFGMRKPLETVHAFGSPLRVFYLLFAAPIWLINQVTNGILRAVFRMEPVDSNHTTHTADELRMIVEETGKAKEVTETEQAIAINALELNELTVRDILTPRNDAVFLDVHRTFRENLEVAVESKHTRFPLVDRHLDKTMGLIHIKDLLGAMQEDAPNLFALKRELMGVSENVPLDEMLQKFLANRAHMALVVDEFGGSIGLVTFDDVLDQVVGEIHDEFDDDEEPGFERISETEFSTDGSLPLHELSDEVPELSLEAADVSTVGGYLTSVLGRLPEQGETAEVGGYTAEIMEADERSIQQVRFVRSDLTDESAPAEDSVAVVEITEQKLPQT